MWTNKWRCQVPLRFRLGIPLANVHNLGQMFLHHSDLQTCIFCRYFIHEPQYVLPIPRRAIFLIGVSGTCPNGMKCFSCAFPPHCDRWEMHHFFFQMGFSSPSMGLCKNQSTSLVREYFWENFFNQKNKTAEKVRKTLRKMKSHETPAEFHLPRVFFLLVFTSIVSHMV